MGFKFTIIRTFALGDERTGWSKKVSLLFRYGMWFSFSFNADITSANADKDLFIAYVSFKRSPSTFVLDSLSDPAKSTNVSVELFYTPFI